MLPELDADTKLTGAGAPLSTIASWVETTCPKCGGPAKRCTDTMDTFVDSSWYYLRYIDPENSTAPADPVKAGQMMPVDLYIGGIEHAVLHLLYARFVSFVMAELGLYGQSPQTDEPFRRLLTQGMVHGKTYTSAVTGRPLRPDEVKPGAGGSATEIATGKTVIETWSKMSKSKHNGIDPGEIIAKYGADAARVFVLFKAPPDAVLDWDDDAISGVSRYRLRRADPGVTVRCWLRSSIAPLLCRKRILQRYGRRVDGSRESGGWCTT